MRPFEILAALAIVHGAAASEPEVAAGNAQNGVLVGHMFPACNGRRVGGHKEWSMEPDVHCLSTPGLGLKVLSPAVCANGTRAKLALFADSKCNGREVTAENGLIDLDDADIGRESCLSTFNELMVVGDNELQKVRSVAFFCDPSQLPEKSNDEEREEKKTPVALSSLAKKGGVSHNTCQSPKHRQTAPRFLHPAPDACQTLPVGRRLRVEVPAVCEDGSRARLARFTGAGCKPDDALPLVDITDDGEVIKACLTWADGDNDLETSYGFACDGVKERQDSGQDQPGSKNGSSDILVLILVLLLMIVISIAGCVSAVRRWSRVVDKVLDLVRGVREGGISL